MRGRCVALHLLLRLSSLAVLLASLLLRAQAPFETPHVPGLHGLEGWKRTEVIEGVKNQGPLPVELIIARNTHIIRRIKGDPFIWRWIFLPNGRQVAYETGPLHFSMACVLLDISSGEQLAIFDCWRDIPKDAPTWLDLLEKPPPPPSLPPAK